MNNESEKSPNQEKLDKIIELLSEIQSPPDSWDKAAKSKIIGNIQEAQQLAHFWCCQPVILRGALGVALLLNLVNIIR